MDGGSTAGIFSLDSPPSSDPSSSSLPLPLSLSSPLSASELSLLSAALPFVLNLDLGVDSTAGFDGRESLSLSEPGPFPIGSSFSLSLSAINSVLLKFCGGLTATALVVALDEDFEEAFAFFLSSRGAALEEAMIKPDEVCFSKRCKKDYYPIGVVNKQKIASKLFFGKARSSPEKHRTNGPDFFEYAASPLRSEPSVLVYNERYFT